MQQCHLVETCTSSDTVPARRMRRDRGDWLVHQVTSLKVGCTVLVRGRSAFASHRRSCSIYRPSLLVWSQVHEVSRPLSPPLCWRPVHLDARTPPVTSPEPLYISTVLWIFQNYQKYWLLSGNEQTTEWMNEWIYTAHLQVYKCRLNLLLLVEN